MPRSLCYRLLGRPFLAGDVHHHRDAPVIGKRCRDKCSATRKKIERQFCLSWHIFPRNATRRLMPVIVRDGDHGSERNLLSIIAQPWHIFVSNNVPDLTLAVL